MSGSRQPHTPRQQVIVVTGPTAVGKTATALRLAQQLNGEIISADSVQVYRGLDIGSDKVSEVNMIVDCVLNLSAVDKYRVQQVAEHERGAIPHHLLDIHDASEEFSAGDFYHAARQAAGDILQVRSWRLSAVTPAHLLHWPVTAALADMQRGKTPIIAGGTGFYLRWFIYGKPRTPRSTPAGEAAAQKTLDEVVHWRILIPCTVAHSSSDFDTDVCCATGLAGESSRGRGCIGCRGEVGSRDGLRGAGRRS